MKAAGSSEAASAFETMKTLVAFDPPLQADTQAPI
jgi:hypothetical protein